MPVTETGAAARIGSQPHTHTHTHTHSRALVSVAVNAPGTEYNLAITSLKINLRLAAGPGGASGA
jgi:hypothetical protein